MTEFYKELQSLGIEEAEERDQVLGIVRKAQERERQLEHRKETDDMDVFTKFVQPGRIHITYGSSQDTTAETQTMKDEYPCVNSALLGFTIGILVTVLLFFIYRVS
jgi:hypothetical protein